ncbi:MAG: DUF3817 domain-containing protein [Frankiales bacterium]|nr:DUF3817 domain-containing protein [Frankiales bacterium]
MNAALQRYRVMANIVGVVLVVFVFIIVYVRGLGGPMELLRVISQIHGLCYLVYLGITIDLSRRVGWTIVRTVLVMLAGTVPFLSFFVERRMTRNVLEHASVA